MSSEPVRIVTPRGKLIGLAAVCGLFTAMGAVVLAVNPTAVLNLVVGVGAMAFFGLGGGFSVLSQWRRSAVLIADDAGIHVRGAGTIAWADVDRIGANTSTLGVRLRDPGAFALHAPEPYSAAALRETRSATGWDLTWAATLLDRTPGEAAAAILSRRPG